jgi:hypothetical protein
MACNNSCDSHNSVDELFNTLFQGGSKPSSYYSVTQGLNPPAPPAPAPKVMEYIFVYQDEVGYILTTESYYTEEEFSRVATDLAAVEFELVMFSERERGLLN